MKEKVKHSLFVLLLSLLIVYGFGFFGSIFAMGETSGSWYETVKPSITPPSWIFPIVWNVLFLLIALSLWLSWIGSGTKKKKGLILWYGINLVSNALWSLLYFGLHNPKLAFFDLLIILISIVNLIFMTYRINRKASTLLIPYLVWVIFAGVLNWLSL